MLRPEQMSKVSVTGAKAVMDDVIEAAHDLNLVHLSDYDGTWDGFVQGSPIEGADEASERLVTVRSLESILDVDEEDAGPIQRLSDEKLEAKLEDVRGEVNELDDRRDEFRSELRDVEERLDAVAPFAELGIDLDLLSGYDTLQVAVGEGDADEVRAALEDDEDVGAFEVFADDDVVAAFAYPEAGAPEDALTEALVGVRFSELEIPDAEGSPEEYRDRLAHRKQQLESKLESVENELEDVKLDAAGFLLAVEEQLSIEVQKREAPLSFATTERSFVAEGWVPTERFAEVERTITEAVDGRVEVEELDRVDHEEYARSGHDHGGAEADEADEADAETGDEPDDREEREPAEPPQAATDGGSAGGPVTMDDDPPVVQDNPEVAKPFEVLVNAVNRPRYDELDPTMILFLTFPVAFGFMIGDIGYGLLYMAMGWSLLRSDSDAISALGRIGLWAGGFTTLFGYLYGELFGIHLEQLLPFHLPASEVLSKGLHASEFAFLWVVVSLLFGLIHLNTAFVLGFFNDRPHGLGEAAVENLSWIMALDGFFLWVFSLHGTGPKPAFLVGEGSALHEFVGFVGFPEPVGLVGLSVAAVGVVLIPYGEGIQGAIEIPTRVLAHSLSYLRMVAVLLAKAGMAFVVNLLVFGAYEESGHGVVFHLPGAEVHGEQLFVGLVHVDPLIVTIPAAIAVFVLGHVLVLLLGITAAGIQMIRLEYVEFFEKFYEGGGEKFQPFGYRRRYTEDR